MFSYKTTKYFSENAVHTLADKSDPWNAHLKIAAGGWGWGVGGSGRGCFIFERLSGAASPAECDLDFMIGHGGEHGGSLHIVEAVSFRSRAECSC